MTSQHPFGLYLYQKERRDDQVLKDLLQLLKTNSQGRFQAFAYVEAENSLLPHLSLWENLQLVVGHTSWKEFTSTVKTECEALVRLIQKPEGLAGKAHAWEKFTISLLKGLHGQGHLLIDMNEDLLSPLMVQNFKKIILKVDPSRQVYLATATSGLWLDCAHSLVCRKNYEFVIKQLDGKLVKNHWAA